MTTPKPEYEFKQIVEYGPLGESALIFNVRVPPTPQALIAAGVFQGSCTGSLDDRPVFDADMRHTLCSKCGMLVWIRNCEFPSGICRNCKYPGTFKIDPVAETNWTPVKPAGWDIDVTTFKDTEKVKIQKPSNPILKVPSGFVESVPIVDEDENAEDAPYSYMGGGSGSVYMGKNKKSWPSVKKPKPEPEFVKQDRRKRPIVFDDDDA